MTLLAEQLANLTFNYFTLVYRVPVAVYVARDLSARVRTIVHCSSEGAFRLHHPDATYSLVYYLR